MQYPTALPTEPDCGDVPIMNLSFDSPADAPMTWCSIDGKIYVNNVLGNTVTTPAVITPGSWFYVEVYFPSGLFTGNVPVTINVFDHTGTLLETVSRPLTGSTFAAQPVT